MLTHLIRSKGPLNIVRRGRAIVSRVGLTADRMARSLAAFVDVLAAYDACATFPVTALTLRRHPSVLRSLLESPARVELAVHGYRHSDMSLLAPPAQAAELAAAANIFHRERIPFTGFRAPYLRWNASLLTALRDAGYAYDSSQSILWPVLDREAPGEGPPGDSDSHARAYLQRLLEFCRPHAAGTFPSLPFWADGLLEIPVSFPDDEMLIERLRIYDPARIAAIWIAALEQCHARGELFVLQLHPERLPLCAEALAAVLERARALRPAVWLATLGDVAAWWQAHGDAAGRTDRWPNAAGSALAITGDIDALTAWDYAWRFLGA